MWVYAYMCISKYLYVCIHACAMTYITWSKDIGNSFHIIWNQMYVYHVSLHHYFNFVYFYFFYHVFFSFFFYHVSVSLFGCKISLSKCNITGAHKPSQVSCSLCSYFCFHLNDPHLCFFMFVISCFSHWMDQIHFSALIRVVMDFYFENELSRWKSITIEMCYIMWLHGPSYREHQKRNFGCMCHVFVIPCDCLCNRKQ